MDLLDLKISFRENMVEDKELIFAGNNKFLNFVNGTSTIFKDEIYIKNNIDKLFDSLIKTIQNKQLEKYRIMKIFGQQFELVNRLDEIINNWIFIRGIIGKYRYSLKYNAKSFEMVISKFKLMYEQEQKFFVDLYLYLNKF